MPEQISIDAIPSDHKYLQRHGDVVIPCQILAA